MSNALYMYNAQLKDDRTLSNYLHDRLEDREGISSCSISHVEERESIEFFKTAM